jgi:hypothetical protein
MDTINDNEIELIALLSRRFAPKTAIKEKDQPSTMVMKSLDMSYEDLKIAKFSKIIINKYNGKLCPAEHEPVFKKFKKEVDTGKPSSYVFHIIPTILNNPISSCEIMNHIMICTDPSCLNESCFYVKNLMKYNLIKTSMNRHDSQKAL